MLQISSSVNQPISSNAVPSPRRRILQNLGVFGGAPQVWRHRLRRIGQGLTGFSNLWSAAIAVVLLVAIAGCRNKSGLEKVVVEGTVTFEGQAIPNGEILFYPVDGTRGSVSGGPIKDGQYVAKGRGGVPAGTHRVEIRAFRAPKRKFKGDVGVEGGPAEQYLPSKFNTRSELTATIEADGSNATQDFDLTIR